MHRKRCRRYDIPGHAHALTFSCYRRLRLLANDRTRGWLIEAMEQARDRTGFDLWAYVIMPEHVHLLAAPRSPAARVADLLGHIKRPVARRAIAHLRANAPTFLDRLTVTRADGSRTRRFWQAGGGFDGNIVEPATAWKVVDYIHANPVRRGLAERPEDWEWSSARWYAGIGPIRLPMDGKPPPPDLDRRRSIP